MRCPYCGFLESKVVDKRETSDFAATRRRRECLSCHKRFSTYERIETVDLVVVKKDGRREPFNPEKLRAGLTRAFEKRPVSTEQIAELVSEVEAELRSSKNTEILTKTIGQIVMKKLKKIDQIAYIRFASVYKNFTEATDFAEVVADLIPERGK